MRPDQLDAALAALADDHRLRQRHALHTPQGPRVRIDGRDYLAFALIIILAVSLAVLRWGNVCVQ